MILNPFYSDWLKRSVADVKGDLSDFDTPTFALNGRVQLQG